MPTRSYKSSRSSRSRDSNRGQPRDGVKGLTADGSTRAWRRMRASLPGKPRRCPDGRPPFVNHKVPRRLGGQDTPSNLEWGCGKNPGVGRPKGS